MTVSLAAPEQGASNRNVANLPGTLFRDMDMRSWREKTQAEMGEGSR